MEIELQTISDQLQEARADIQALKWLALALARTCSDPAAARDDYESSCRLQVTVVEAVAEGMAGLTSGTQSKQWATTLRKSHAMIGALLPSGAARE